MYVNNNYVNTLRNVLCAFYLGCLNKRKLSSMIYLILLMLLTGDRFQMNAALLDFLFIKELFPALMAIEYQISILF